MSSITTSNVIVFFDSAQCSALEGFKTCQVSMPIAIQRALTTDDMQRIVNAVQREIDTIKEQEDEWNAHLERNRRALQDLLQEQQQQHKTLQKRSASEANEANEAEMEHQTKKSRQEEEKMEVEKVEKVEKMEVEKADCAHNALYSATSPIYSPIYMPNDTSLVCPNCATIVHQTDVAETEDAPTSPVYDCDGAWAFGPTSPCYDPTSPDYSPIEEQEVVEKKDEEADAKKDEEADEKKDEEADEKKDEEADEKKDEEADAKAAENVEAVEDRADSPLYTPTSPSYSKDTRCLGTVTRGPRKGRQCQWTALKSNDLGLCGIHWKQLHTKTEHNQRLKRISDTVDRAIKTITIKRKFDADFRPLTLTRSKSVDV
jgi:hypothetical protein